MKTLHLLLLSIAFCLLNFGCQGKGSSSSEGNKEKPVEVVQNAPKGPMLPIMNKETFDKIMIESTSMDIIPYTSQVTLSVNDNASIQKFILRYVSNKEVVNGLTCTKPDGRMLILDKKANYVVQTDIYFNAQCQYFVFFLGDSTTPSFATQMTADGKDYFSRVFSKNAAEELKKLQAK